MNLKFEWDAQKARINFSKHGIDFDEARTVFDDPYVFTTLDDRYSIEENRFVSIGPSIKQRLLLVIHTQREEQSDTIIIRIISCRKATPLERRKYEEGE